MRTVRKVMAISFAMLSVCSAAVGGTDKTLVSWVALDHTVEQGGSALTLQRGDQFDGIVFGERVAGKWMAGSEGFARTQGSQQANAVEPADRDTLIQMAVVYQGNRIALFRDGEPYASSDAMNSDLLGAKDNRAVFGLRHVGATTGQHLQGTIEDARIYDRALTVSEIKELKPNQPSRIRPYAWWTFEPGKETDRTGRFPINNLSGGAQIERGRLLLHTVEAVLVASAQKSVAPDLTEPETPAIYALSGGSNPQLMKSQDLKSWLYLSDLYHEDFPAALGVSKAEDTSCANMLRIGDKWMLLCISHALGARYYLEDANPLRRG